jgi:hypothetical protein
MADLATALAAFLMQVGARHISFEMTDAQRKLMQYPIAKGTVLFAMFYITTKSILISLILVAGYFLITMVLLNENHKYNVYSRPWLQQHGFGGARRSTNGLSLADIYKMNITTIPFI